MRVGSTAYLLGGTFRHLSWVEWGDPHAPVILCVHGLTRNGRDFDALADGLADRFRVVCPDLPGRGLSQWLDRPEQYALPSYVAALSHLLAATGGPVGWVGTSLGGICGMAVAAMPGNPVSRLVLNDIGPFIPAAALARIRDYLAAAPAEFADRPALEAELRRVHAPFGRLTDAQWAHLARHSGRALANGRLALHYDPAIREPILASPPEDVNLSAMWSAITVPRLVLRGADSDLLLELTLAGMTRDGARTISVPGCGHAPALMDAATIAAVRAFLLGEADAA